MEQRGVALTGRCRPR
ncbi:hypothetical protein [Rhizobium leguminosarum]